VDPLNGDRTPGAFAFCDAEIGIAALPILMDDYADFLLLYTGMKTG
jgi:hypothetical protein